MNNKEVKTGEMWVRCMSTKTNRYYYFNTLTKESRWEEPPGAEIHNYEPNYAAPEAEHHMNYGETQNPTINSTGVIESQVKPLTNYGRKCKAGMELPQKRQIYRNSLPTPKCSSIPKANNPRIPILDAESMKQIPDTNNTCLPTVQTDSMKRVRDTNNTRLPPVQTDSMKRVRDTEQKNVKTKIGFRTPIQDRQMKIKEELLKKQQLPKSQISHVTSQSNQPYIVTDLRSKLNNKKRKHESSSSFSSDSAMECEFNSTDERNTSVNSEDDKRRRVSPSIPMQEESCKLKATTYLICDTNVLLDDPKFVENLITKGSFNGVPIKIVVPNIVFTELEKIKYKKESRAINANARLVSRIINKCIDHENFILQDGSTAKEPTDSLSLEINDDFVLNCGLQYKKKCGEGEQAFLMTNDNILRGKSSSFNLKSYNWITFKRWATSNTEEPHVKYVSPTKFEDEKMDVDPYPESRCSGSPKTIPSIEHAADDSHHNLTRSTLEEIKVRLQTYLHEVLDEKLTSFYTPIPGCKNEKYGNCIKPSWTIYNYLYGVVNKWDLFNSTYSKKEVMATVRRIAFLMKKYSSDMEVIDKSVIEELFALCDQLISIILPSSKELSEKFSKELDVLKTDWKESVSSPSLITKNALCCSVDDDSVNKACIALENIYNNLNHRFKICSDVEENPDTAEPNLGDMTTIFQTLNPISFAINRVFKEEIDSLSSSLVSVKELKKKITNFRPGYEGVHWKYDGLNTSSVVELFQDKSCRKSAEVLLDNFNKLNFDVVEYLKNNQAENDHHLSPLIDSD